MKRTSMKNFAGLTYVTVVNIPVRETELGDVIDLKAGELERLVAFALIKRRVPIRGAEFRVLKSAVALSNNSIADKLGISRNTVLGWGKDTEKRLPLPYEMLVRVLVAEALGVRIEATLDGLRPESRAYKFQVKAA